MATFTGTAGNDNLAGSIDDDLFKLFQGGNDTAFGGAGNDVFRMEGTLTAADSIDGGLGNNKLILFGDYSAGVVFGAATIANMKVLRLSGDFTYSLTTNNANVAAGDLLSVKASKLGAGHSLSFNGSAETNGHFSVRATKGSDTIFGGAQSDQFLLTKGGDDHVSGGGGGDTFFMGGALTAADTIDGGTGNDTLAIAGNYWQFNFGSAMINVETLLMNLSGGNALYTDDANIAAGKLLTVDTTGSVPSANIAFDGVAETDGSFRFILGVANTYSFRGGEQADTFELAQAAASLFGLSGSGGDDTFNTGAKFGGSDLLLNGGSGYDTVNLDGDYSAGVTIFQYTIMGVEALVLADGNSYDLTTHDGNVASGQTLTVDASALAASDTLTLDGSAETDGSFNIIGGAGDDVIDLKRNGTDTVDGGGGDDTISLGAFLDSTDTIKGGGGSDTVILDGDQTPIFGAHTVTNVETLMLAAGHGYWITTADATVAAGETLTVDASALSPGSSYLSFEGGAETDGHFHFIVGNSYFTSVGVQGGAQSDVFDIGDASLTQFLGLGGDDTLNLGDSYPGDFKVDGGADFDTATFDADYSGGLVIEQHFMSGFGFVGFFNMEAFGFAGGHSYTVEVVGDVSGGGGLAFDAGTLGTGDSIDLDLTAATSGGYAVTGGAGNDVVNGGANANTMTGGAGLDTLYGGAAADSIDGGGDNDALTGNGGADTLTGGDGEDTFCYKLASESTSTTHDAIPDFNADSDFLSFGFAVTAVEAGHSGTIGAAKFDDNLNAVVNGGLGDHSAMICTATDGDLAGHVYLVVNRSNDSSYDAGVDFVIDITGYTGTLDTSDFI